MQSNTLKKCVEDFVSHSLHHPFHDDGSFATIFLAARPIILCVPELLRLRIFWTTMRQGHLGGHLVRTLRATSYITTKSLDDSARRLSFCAALPGSTQQKLQKESMHTPSPCYQGSTWPAHRSPSPSPLKLQEGTMCNTQFLSPPLSRVVITSFSHINDH